MNKIALAKCLVIFVLLFCVDNVSAQEVDDVPDQKLVKYVDPAVLPRAESLAQADPASYVSEASYAAEWFSIYSENVVWERRVWRSIDLRDARNAALAQASARIPLEVVLAKGAPAVLAGAKLDDYAYAYFEDGDFSKRISDDALKALAFSGQQKAKPAMKFRIKEVWMYLAEERMLVCRITGIAPVREVVATDGVITEEPLFWVYYPAIRQLLREQHMSGAEAKDLDEFFETRQYFAPIDKAPEAYWPGALE